MIDKTRYAIVHTGPLSVSGQDEIVVRFVLKKDCIWALKERYGSVAKARLNGIEIRKLKT